MAQLLPDDVLADVLRRLGPHGLAASRCVCKAWRAVVDAGRMLPTDQHLLPLSMAGFFTVPWSASLPEYFARPSSSRIASKFDYLDTHDSSCLEIKDHCNGLLLLGNDWVLNPAFTTRTALEHARLGERRRSRGRIPCLTPPCRRTTRIGMATVAIRLACLLITDKAVGEEAIGHMQSVSSPGHCYAAYWPRALYVHQHDFVIRINLSNDKYQPIKLPKGNDAIVEPRHYIGKSEKGVYCTLHDGLRLWVWFLDESCGQMEWMLKHDISLEPLLANSPWKYGARPWRVQYANDHDEDEKSEEAPTGQELEWDYSNNDNATVAEDRSVECYRGYTISLLGFHPYREIVCFRTSFGRVAAYHFNSLKIEDLGCLPVKCSRDYTYSSFPYSPCRMGELSDNK